MIRHGLNACSVRALMRGVVLAPLFALLVATIRGPALGRTTLLPTLRLGVRAAHLAPVAARAHEHQAAALRAAVHPK